MLQILVCKKHGNLPPSQQTVRFADLLGNVIFIDLNGFYEYIKVSIKLNSIYLVF